jgi:hypothetical protein
VNSINSTTNSNKVSVEYLKADVSKVIVENVALKQRNETLGDDVIDMKCRSMKGSRLFFDISEGIAQIPGRRFCLLLFSRTNTISLISRCMELKQQQQQHFGNIKQIKIKT